MSKLHLPLRVYFCHFLLPLLNVKIVTHRKLLAFSLSSLIPSWKDLNPFNEKTDSANRYWIHKTVPEIVAEADKLFEQKKYLEVYELLNRLKFNNSVEVQWRIGRVLFKMSRSDDLSRHIKREMIHEAYDILTAALILGQENPNVHKWLAVVIYAKTEYEGTEARIKAYCPIKRHLRRAVELQPDDVVALHMLGKLCYELAHLTHFQRLLAKVIYAQPPVSTYEEAFEYFEKAETIHPRFYLPNLYMLGKTCLELKQYFRANYYLNIAANLPAITEYERWCARHSRQIAESLKEYDVTQDAVFLKMPLDN